MDGSEPQAEFPVTRAALCGLLAMFVAIGIARFGYAPLVPALVAAHWFSASAAFAQGAVNLLGYLIGAAIMRVWRGRIAARPAVTALMGLTSLSLLASAWDGGAIYLGLWRLVSGITGGLLMVLMAAAVVGRAPPDRRGRVGGITFAGMGTGIAFSGLVIPKILPLGLPCTWVLLGLCGLAATAVVGFAMPDATITPPRGTAKRAISRPVLLLITGYALCALGFVPHMLFLASFVAIFLHRGIAAGAEIAAIMGISAAFGPPLLGRIADRFGFLTTLAGGYVVMSLAVALPLFTGSFLGLALSACGVGVVALGAVMLTSGALAGLVPADRLAASWGLATITYAIMQALVAAGFSSLFHLTGSYLLLFGIGTLSSLASAGLVLAARYAAFERSAG